MSLEISKAMEYRFTDEPGVSNQTAIQSGLISSAFEKKYIVAAESLINENRPLERDVIAYAGYCAYHACDSFKKLAKIIELMKILILRGGDVNARTGSDVQDMQDTALGLFLCRIVKTPPSLVQEVSFLYSKGIRILLLNGGRAIKGPGNFGQEILAKQKEKISATAAEIYKEHKTLILLFVENINYDSDLALIPLDVRKTIILPTILRAKSLLPDPLVT